MPLTGRRVAGNLFKMVKPPRPKRKRRSVESLFRAAHKAEESGKEQTAVRLYKKILKQSANLSGVESVLNNLGQICVNQSEGNKSRLGQAQRYFRLALKRNPKYARAAYNLGLCFYIRYEHDKISGSKKSKSPLKKAIEYFRLSFRLDPEYPDTWYSLGTLLAETGRKKGALKYLRMVRFPDCATLGTIKKLSQTKGS